MDRHPEPPHRAAAGRRASGPLAARLEPDLAQGRPAEPGAGVLRGGEHRRRSRPAHIAALNDPAQRCDRRAHPPSHNQGNARWTGAWVDVVFRQRDAILLVPPDAKAGDAFAVTLTGTLADGTRITAPATIRVEGR